MTEHSEECDDEYSETFESFNAFSDLQSGTHNTRPLSALSSHYSSIVDNDSIVKILQLRSGDPGTARTVSTARSYSPSFCTTVSDSGPALSRSLQYSRHFHIKSTGTDASKAGSEKYSETFESIDGSDCNNSPFASDSEQEDKVKLEVDDSLGSSRSSTYSGSSSVSSYGSVSRQSSDSALDRRKQLHSNSKNSYADLSDNSDVTSNDPYNSIPFSDAADLLPVDNDYKNSPVTSLALKKHEEYDGRRDISEPQLNSYFQSKIQLLRRKDGGQHSTIVKKSDTDDHYPKISSLTDADEDMVNFVKSKLVFARKRIDCHHSDVHDTFRRQHDARRLGDPFSCSVEHYGISPSVLSRLKLQRTLERVEKTCELHEEITCHICREETDLIAFKDFLAAKRALVGEKLTTERLDSQLLLRDPLTLAGELARYATYLGKHPEQALQELLRPLKTRHKFDDVRQ